MFEIQSCKLHASKSSQLDYTTFVLQSYDSLSRQFCRQFFNHVRICFRPSLYIIYHYCSTYQRKQRQCVTKCSRDLRPRQFRRHDQTRSSLLFPKFRQPVKLELIAISINNYIVR